MQPGTRDYQQMAIALLAIATAALGLGIWAQDFDLTPPDAENPWFIWLYWARVAGVGAAVSFYFVTLSAVLKILWQAHAVTGRDLVRYPLAGLYIQMIVLAFLFLSGYASDLIAAWHSGNMPTPEPPA